MTMTSCTWQCMMRDRLDGIRMFSTEIFLIERQEEKIYLGCGVEFELKEELEAVGQAFLEVELWFCRADEYKSPTSLLLKKYKRFRLFPLNPVPLPTLLTYISLEYDGIFTSTCDLLISFSRLGCNMIVPTPSDTIPDSGSWSVRGLLRSFTSLTDLKGGKEVSSSRETVTTSSRPLHAPFVLAIQSAIVDAFRIRQHVLNVATAYSLSSSDVPILDVERVLKVWEELLKGGIDDVSKITGGKGGEVDFERLRCGVRKGVREAISCDTVRPEVFMNGSVKSLGLIDELVEVFERRVKVLTGHVLEVNSGVDLKMLSRSIALDSDEDTGVREDKAESATIMYQLKDTHQITKEQAMSLSSEELPSFTGTEHKPIHLVVLVHGLLGHATDLRPYRNRVRILLEGLGGCGSTKFLMSKENEEIPFADLREQAGRLVKEVLRWVDEFGSEIGRVRCAIASTELDSLRPKFHSFITLGSPHLSIHGGHNLLFSAISPLYRMVSGLDCLKQLTLSDAPSIPECLLFKLSLPKSKGGLNCLTDFQDIRLYASINDGYVEPSSALVMAFDEHNGKPSDNAGVIDVVSTSADNAVAEMVRNLNATMDSKRTQRYLVWNDGWGASLFDPLGRKAHVSLVESASFFDVLAVTLKVAVSIFGWKLHILLRDVEPVPNTHPPQYRGSARVDYGHGRTYSFPVQFGEMESMGEVRVEESPTHAFMPPVHGNMIVNWIIGWLWVRLLEVSPVVASRMGKLSAEKRKRLWRMVLMALASLLALGAVVSAIALQAVRYQGDHLIEVDKCEPGDDCIARLKPGIWYDHVDVNVFGRRVLPVSFAVHQSFPTMREEQKRLTMMISGTAHPSVSCTYHLKQGQKVVMNVAASKWSTCFLELDIHGQGIGFTRLNLTDVLRDMNSTTYVFTRPVGAGKVTLDFLARPSKAHESCEQLNWKIKTEGPTLMVDSSSAFSKCLVPVTGHACSLSLPFQAFTDLQLSASENRGFRLNYHPRTSMLIIQFGLMSLSALLCVAAIWYAIWHAIAVFGVEGEDVGSIGEGRYENEPLLVDDEFFDAEQSLMSRGLRPDGGVEGAGGV
ncbi:hypothetical protein HDU67_004253 [Dinochytrium kinnereticum]|nr:hypothetical protein HDU67_004253 [Dinochytrium kinnereticum]